MAAAELTPKGRPPFRALVADQTHEAGSLYLLIWFDLRVRADEEYGWSLSKLSFTPSTVRVIASFEVLLSHPND